MKTEQDVKQTITNHDSSVVITSVEEMTPDASMRRYYRAQLKNSSWAVSTVVAMVFDSTKPAEVGDGPVVNADDAYVQLTNYFSNKKIRVPKIFCDDRKNSILIIEDLGDCLLGSLLGDASKQELLGLYKQAIDYAKIISNIPIEQDKFFFQRSFSKSLYDKELAEYSDFFLAEKGLSKDQAQSVKVVFDKIVQELTSLPKCLVHRDFHSWNIIVSDDAKVQVIDFQDACMGPAAYDVISLLHDRDTDLLLGAEVLGELQKYYFDSSDVSPEEYYLTSLQRDLKVVGRFSKLVQERGLVRYQKWIPTTQRRVISNLKRLSGVYGEFKLLLAVIKDLDLEYAS